MNRSPYKYTVHKLGCCVKMPFLFRLMQLFAKVQHYPKVFVYFLIHFLRKKKVFVLTLIPPKLFLKVPKRENFSLAFFARSEAIWVCDLGTGEKNRIFYQVTPDLDSFWFFAAH